MGIQPNGEPIGVFSILLSKGCCSDDWHPLSWIRMETSTDSRPKAVEALKAMLIQMQHFMQAGATGKSYEQCLSCQDRVWRSKDKERIHSRRVCTPSYSTAQCNVWEGSALFGPHRNLNTPGSTFLTPCRASSCSDRAPDPNPIPNLIPNHTSV